MSESIGKEFMRKTAYAYVPESAQRRGLPQPPLELPDPQGAERVELPRPDRLNIPAIELRQAIDRRVTGRRYSDAPLSLEELSYLLWCSQGVKEVTGRPATLRTVPSAGARHAFETILLANRVEGLEPGLYRFGAIEHVLFRLGAPVDITDQLVKACHDQEQVRASAATFFWAAVVARMQWRYPERGYRYLHLDAGHVCQNLALAAEAVGARICPIAAFDDDQLNAALQLDGEEQFIIYLASLGKRVV